jgi:uncharacterized protein (DUF885 family)
MKAFRPAPLERRAFLKLSAATAALALAGCAGDLVQADANTAAPATAEDRKLLAFFAKSFTRDLEESPEFMTAIGLKKRYGEWNDYSAAYAEYFYRNTAADLDFMRTKIDRAALSPAMRVSLDVFIFRNEQRVANYPFRLHNYDVSHFGGQHQEIPNLLINRHRIDDISDAEAFIARIRAAEKPIDDGISFLRDQQAKGVTLPRFSYGLMLADLRATIAGKPFAGNRDNDILAAFKTKIGALAIDDAAKAKLTADAEKALTEKLGPAYERLIAAVQEIAATVKTDHGLSNLPNGRAFYDERIANHTTLKLTADQIHELGQRSRASRPTWRR